MPTGYLVTLDDGSLDAMDAIAGTPGSFATASTLGTGSWSWSGAWSGDGNFYTGITDTGVYYLATDGNVYFVPDTWTINSGSAHAASTPAYANGEGILTDAPEGGFDSDRLIVTHDPRDTESRTVTLLNGDALDFTDIDTVSIVPCFTPGTHIKTIRGEVPVEQLQVGDRALTRDNGYQPIRWVGMRDLDPGDLQRRKKLRPIRIRAGALGHNVPQRDMMVSPQHRMLMGNTTTQARFGEEEVLVAAKHLTCMDGVDPADVDSVTYVHILFDQHEVVLSDGAWSESFQPGDRTLSSLDAVQRCEIIELFPELGSMTNTQEVYPAARSTLQAHQARVLVLN